MADHHVVLNTPTGSGKSLVALAMHFRAMARGRRSIYTSPIKALVNEKFFDLCRHLGAKNVGMMTGDAAINADAPVICCTAEVLSAMALSEGEAASAHYVIMDEFHYYSDRDRGSAWQIPLLILKKSIFMLMSATLGEMDKIILELEELTEREVAVVSSSERPVPLYFDYSLDPLLESIQEALRKEKAPIYVVSFTQRECAELAQKLSCIKINSKEQRGDVQEALKGQAFNTPYGKDIRRFAEHGIGIHHAGLLPRYRLLIEGLAQEGLLKIIFGTDTLGVGINVPLRSVIFNKLFKYDGQKTRLLSVRDFKQISGRAGRKGFDDQGWVICQAPEHVIENRRLEIKAGGDAKKLRRMRKKKPPERGYVHWDEQSYRKLIEGEAEPLRSRFKVDYGTLINMMQREKALLGPSGGYAALIQLIGASHERSGRKSRLRRRAASLFKALRSAGVIEVEKQGGGSQAQVSPELQRDFSMYHTLSLYLIFALAQLEMEEKGYHLKVLTLVESILEDPHLILLRQQSALRRIRNAELKAEGFDYDERQEKLEEIHWPMPEAEMIFESYEAFAATRPWVTEGLIHPKSIARHMFENYATFNGYVKEYGLERIEGVLLRYLTQSYKGLLQGVPEPLKTDEVYELVAYLRTTLQKADSSLLNTWEAMAHGKPLPKELEEVQEGPADILDDPKLFRARVRAELHGFLQALSRLNYDEALNCLRRDEEDLWTGGRLVEALRPFYADFDTVVFNHQARHAGHTRLEATGPRCWRVRQVICDPLEENFWYLEGEIDLTGIIDPVGPMIALRELRS